ncbi:hypothetical protein [Roseixanthobacter glucoisosaccharinicivorans]|uniref:hypothetical protein n=1 Tax=Roseixanthobacter glucoisosaccharinicivorans TaxID=3119923 RepID=UPI00372AE904
MNAALEAADIVWFDVCKTLFIRPLVEPEHLFDLVGASVGMPDFRSRRLAAEALARQQAGVEQPLTLDLIYDHLEASPTERNLAKRTEYRFEQALWLPNPRVEPMFRDAAALGRAALAGSTHLPAAFFEELLAHHALPRAPLFLSQDGAGSLDPVALAMRIAHDLDVAPDRIFPLVHEGAESAPLEQGAFPLPTEGGAASVAFGMNRLASGLPQGSCEALGFRVAGPVATGFHHWLDQQARRDNIDLLLLCPGVGAAIERMSRHPDAPSLCRHDYFRVGPTVIMLAGTHDRNFDTRIDMLLAGAHGLRTFELLQRLDIPAPASFVLADIGLGDDVVIDATTEPLVRRFLSAYRWEILKVARRNRRGLFRSLLDHGLTPKMRVALVDIGWDGTLVESFAQALEHMFDVEIFGYSLCLLDTPESRRRQGRFNLKGLFSRASLPAERLAALGGNRTAIELLFTPPHREIIGLDDLPGAIVPIESEIGPSSERLAGVSNAVMEGIAAFAAPFNTFCVRARFQPEPIAVCQPFLVVATDPEAVAGPIVAALET